jgi:chorismate mutase
VTVTDGVGVRGLRGAITVEEDRREAVLSATRRLLEEMLARNGLTADDLISVILTATGDLRSAFPAEAAREAGWTDVPLLDARELDVEDGLARCVRVLMHVRSDRPRSEMRHVYLEGAARLREDLSG